MDKQYTLQLTLAEIQIIANALVAMPFKDVALVISSIEKQVKEQNDG